MTDSAILGIDIGTSSCKAVVFDTDGSMLASAKESYALLTLSDGYVEQDPKEYWRATVACVRRILQEKPSLRDAITAIGLTGQVPTDIFLNGDGEPLMNGISWQDTRAVREAAQLREKYTAEQMLSMVGSNVPLSPSWSASRLLWLTQNRAELAKKCKKILLPKDYVGYKMTGDFLSDGWSCKSTVNILTNTPCTSLLEFLGFTDAHMPRVASWSSLRGTLSRSAAEELGLSQRVLISNGCSDAPATMLGCGVLSRAGVAFNSCGTSEIVGMSMNGNAMCPQLMTIPSTVTDACSIIYGPTQSGGNSLMWFAHSLLQTEDIDGLLALAEHAPAGSNGLLFLPYISGERSPLWNPDVRGCFASVGAAHNRADFVRAILEGVGCSVRHCLSFATSAAGGMRPSALRVTGGGSRTALWRQIKADICNLPVETLACDEACALGAAMTAAVGTQRFADYAEASAAMIAVAQVTEPNPNTSALYDTLFTQYLRESAYAVERVRD